MTAVAESITARYGEPKPVKELTEEILDKQSVVKQSYRMNILFMDGERINMEINATSMSSVIKMQAALMTKPVKSSCIYSV